MNYIVNRHLDRAQKQVIYELTLKKQQSKKSTMSEKQVAARQQLALELMQERRVPIGLRAQDSLMSNDSTSTTSSSSSSAAASSSSSSSSSVDCAIYADQHSLSGIVDEQTSSTRSLMSSRVALVSSPPPSQAGLAPMATSTPVATPVAAAVANNSTIGGTSLVADCYRSCGCSGFSRCSYTGSSGGESSTGTSHELIVIPDDELNNSSVPATVAAALAASAASDNENGVCVETKMAPSSQVESAFNCHHHHHQQQQPQQQQNDHHDHHDHHLQHHNDELQQQQRAHNIVDRRASLKHQEAVDYPTSFELETDIQVRKKEANIKFNKTRLEHLNGELERRLHQYEYLVTQEKALLGTYNMMLFTNEGVNNFHLYEQEVEAKT